jgi:acetylornithine/succinyldiaminopimelate/putrescine aminotransferase
MLTALRAICDKHGILLIADEIQAGFGRTGTWFAVEHSGVVPDLITVAKSMAGGYPLAGVIGRADVMDAMDPGGLGKMDMTHQKRLSVIAGLVAFVAVVVVAVFADWGPLASSVPDAAQQIEDLGLELLGRSMLIFETAGLTILTAMIAATAVAVEPIKRNRD